MSARRRTTSVDELDRRLDDGTWQVVDVPGRGTSFGCDQPGPAADSPVVVLLHGWTATASLNWGATMAALQVRYRVIALDHRGHGAGIRGPGPFTLEDCADDAVALLDRCGVDSAIFVGYSMGGPIAQLVWQRHPERVRGLAFCATAADFTTTVDRRPFVRAMEEAQRASRLIPRAVRMSFARPWVGGLIPDPVVRRQLLAALAAHDERSIHQAGREIRRFSSTRWIGGVEVPTVCIVTERDRLVRPALQLELAALIPGARVIRIDGSHVAAFTHPELVADAVLTACDLVAAPPPTRPGAVSRFRRLRRAFRRHRPGRR